ncbi:hypothetical protein IWQ62_001807 [Dispira parvispora]|uniref:Uncharacterized protein n=1 Tax=Dispira parvispora TaxID=1520584 RepID=A0A9W8E3E9_9FUNG|nr:hypothetical protein IWQ62_001807 [Dispira parvispora]
MSAILYGSIGHLYLVVTTLVLCQFYVSTVPAYPIPHVSPSTGTNAFANGPLLLVANRRSAISKITTLVNGDKKPTVLQPKCGKDSSKKAGQKVNERLMNDDRSPAKRPAMGNTIKQSWSTKVREWAKQNKDG